MEKRLATRGTELQKMVRVKIETAKMAMGKERGIPLPKERGIPLPNADLEDSIPRVSMMGPHLKRNYILCTLNLKIWLFVAACSRIVSNWARKSVYSITQWELCTTQNVVAHYSEFVASQP